MALAGPEAATLGVQRAGLAPAVGRAALRGQPWRGSGAEGVSSCLMWSLRSMSFDLPNSRLVGLYYRSKIAAGVAN